MKTPKTKAPDPGWGDWARDEAHLVGASDWYDIRCGLSYQNNYEKAGALLDLLYDVAEEATDQEIEALRNLRQGKPIWDALVDEGLMDRPRWWGCVDGARENLTITDFGKEVIDAYERIH